MKLPLVFSYFIPEDGDTELSPNVFLAPKKGAGTGFAPRLGEIKQSFPLPGSYHFRFKTALVPGTDREKGALPVWMDCVDDDQYVGVWQNSIIAKVTRISVEDDDDDDSDFPVSTPNDRVTHSAPPSVHHSAAPSPSQSLHGAGSSSDQLLGVFDEPSPPPSTHTSTGNLLDVPTAPPTAPPVSGEASLLDMSAPAAPHTTTSHHDDFLGMTAPAPSPTATRGYVPQQPQQTMPVRQPQRAPVLPRPKPPPTNNQQGNAFNNFSNSQGPFGGLEWK